MRKGCMMFAKDGAVLIWGGAGRLHAGRPDLARGCIAHEDESAKRACGGFRPPAGDGHVAPAAEPFARRGQHHAVVAVGKQVRRRCIGGRGVERAHHGGIAVLDRANQHFCRAGRRAGHIAGNAFLQQKFHPFDHRFGMKTVAQAAVLQDVGDGRDRHALMMRHKTAHYGMALIGGQPCRRKIDGLIKPVTAFRAKCGKGSVILRGGGRVDHRGQARGIGGNHAIFAKATLQPQARNTEIGILISHFQIAGVVRRLRYAPRNTKTGSIASLACNDKTGGLFQHGTRRCSHHQ